MICLACARDVPLAGQYVGYCSPYALHHLYRKEHLYILEDASGFAHPTIHRLLIERWLQTQCLNTTHQPTYAYMLYKCHTAREAPLHRHEVIVTLNARRSMLLFSSCF